MRGIIAGRTVTADVRISGSREFPLGEGGPVLASAARAAYLAHAESTMSRRDAMARSTARAEEIPKAHVAIARPAFLRRNLPAGVTSSSHPTGKEGTAKRNVQRKTRTTKPRLRPTCKQRPHTKFHGKNSELFRAIKAEEQLKMEKVKKREARVDVNRRKREQQALNERIRQNNAYLISDRKTKGLDYGDIRSDPLQEATVEVRQPPPPPDRKPRVPAKPKHLSRGEEKKNQVSPVVSPPSMVPELFSGRQKTKRCTKNLGKSRNQHFEGIENVQISKSIEFTVRSLVIPRKKRPRRLV
jgi:hypothetical protein